MGISFVLIGISFFAFYLYIVYSSKRFLKRRKDGFMMRLDKFLCDLEIGSRKEVKDYIRKGLIRVNDEIQKKPEYQINESQDTVRFRDTILTYQKFVYYLMYKPAGVITASRDKKEKTVLDLLPDEYKRKDVFAVGRLDKDTTGLLLLTNNGALSHKLLSAKYHVWKKYLVTTKVQITEEQIELLRNGVDLGEEDGFSLPAKCDIIVGNDFQFYLSIREGKYHQVKRMLKAVGNEVTALKRVGFGPILLPEDMLPGETRRIEIYESDQDVFIYKL